MLTTLILLGLLQAIMQCMMFYNPFAFLDKKFKTNWFADTSLPNKDKWGINLFGKKFYVFRYFPLIMITDLFHLCHGIFGILIGVLLSHNMQDKLFSIFIGWFAYSVTFEIFLRIIKATDRIKNHNMLFKEALKNILLPEISFLF